MSVLNVRRSFTPVKNSHRWIDAAFEFPAVDAVDEIGAVAGGLGFGVQVLELSDQVVGNHVIGVKSKHPRSNNSSLTEAEFPLVAVGVK